MRRLGSVLIVALLAAALPTTGQAEQNILTDDEGDVEVTSGGQPAPQLKDRYRHIDVISLDLEEDVQTFAFTLTVADLERGDDAGRTEYRVHFWHGDIHYAVLVQNFGELTGSHFYWGNLVVIHETESRPDYVSRVDVESDTAAGTLRMTVERDKLPDQNGATPFPGRQLEDFYVEATARLDLPFTFGGMATVHASDRMPDEDLGPAYDVRLGVQQSTLATLHSEEPMRISNGGATTIVYEVQATNLDERRHSYRLAAENVPEGWDVSLPFERFSLEAEDTRSLPILLVTPSGHQHGGIEKFLVSMQSDRDREAFGKVHLGLRYTDIPQPAGHHPKIWFHSRAFSDGTVDEAGEALGLGWNWPYMNAAEDDPSDEGVPAPAQWGSAFPGQPSDWTWNLKLSPGLSMGLDFDLDGSVTFEVPISYPYMLQNATLAAALSVGGEEDVIRVAEGVSQPASFGPDETHRFSLALPPKEAADFITYKPPMGMQLQLRLTGVPVAPPGVFIERSPLLQPGGWMELPLKEYRDPTDVFFRAVEGIRFERDFIESQVNPGASRIFEVDLTNAGDTTDTVHLNLTGTHPDWVRLLGRSSFELKPGMQRSVAVAVSIPEGIPDGTVVDLALSASGQENPFQHAFVELIAIVDTEADHPDDADAVADLEQELSKGRQSPGFEFVAVLAVLAAVLLVWPRRRT